MDHGGAQEQIQLPTVSRVCICGPHWFRVYGSGFRVYGSGLATCNCVLRLSAARTGVYVVWVGSRASVCLCEREMEGEREGDRERERKVCVCERERARTQT